jgi:hypothetical protein
MEVRLVSLKSAERREAIARVSHMFDAIRPGKFSKGITTFSDKQAKQMARLMKMPISLFTDIMLLLN